MTLDRNFKVEVAGRDGSDRQPLGLGGGFGNDGRIGPEAGLDYGCRAVFVVHRLFADDGMDLQVALQQDAGFLESRDGETGSGKAALHVGRPESKELLSAPYRLPRISGSPGFGLERCDRVDMPVEEQGAPAAGALQYCRQIDPLRIDCDVMEFEAEVAEIGADEARTGRLSADHGFASDAGKARIDAVDGHELLKKLLRAGGEAGNSVVDASRKCKSLHVYCG